MITVRIHFPCRAWIGLLFLLMIGVFHAPLAAQDVRFGTDGWEVGAFTGQLNDEPEFEPEGTGDQLANDAIFGLRGGYVLPANVFFQGEAAISFPEVQLVDGSPRIPMESYFFGGDVGYNFQPRRDLQIFVSGGAEAVVWQPGAGFDTETDFGIRYGAGARYYVAPNLAVRGDLRWHQVRDALQDSRAAALGVTNAAEEDLWAMEISGGLSIFFGGPQDSDGDGLYDAEDACPDSPEGVIVDERGCAEDGDDDGVPDGLDRCPRTAQGATVDAEGCPSDFDGDMILDGIDECPNTPARATVDDQGCPSDSDDDGVLDGLDRCPDTPEGAEIDAFGCPTGALGIILSDFVSQLNQLTVWFDLDSAQPWEQSQPTLDLLGQALVQNPGLVIDVEGHADAIGPEEYNLELSRERAESVRTYLLENFSEIEDDQIGITALGETDPTVPNDTEAGRQKNRRAVVVVVEPLPDN